MCVYGQLANKVRVRASTDSEVEAELVVLRKLNNIMAQVDVWLAWKSPFCLITLRNRLKRRNCLTSSTRTAMRSLFAVTSIFSLPKSMCCQLCVLFGFMPARASSQVPRCVGVPWGLRSLRVWKGWRAIFVEMSWANGTPCTVFCIFELGWATRLDVRLRTTGWQESRARHVSCLPKVVQGRTWGLGVALTGGYGQPCAEISFGNILVEARVPQPNNSDVLSSLYFISPLSWEHSRVHRTNLTH